MMDGFFDLFPYIRVYPFFFTAFLRRQPWHINENCIRIFWRNLATFWHIFYSSEVSVTVTEVYQLLVKRNEMPQMQHMFHD